VRFIQVNYGDNSANPAWDQHSNLPKHADQAAAVDRPIAGLLADLQQRGLLEDTIVWWGGEFGRTPYAQENGTGRDHNPGGFTLCLAGGGVKPGYAHGETDEFGFRAIQGKVHIHDLHASLLYAMGLDHERLTFEHVGRNFRLTDVYGASKKRSLPKLWRCFISRNALESVQLWNSRKRCINTGSARITLTGRSIRPNICPRTQPLRMVFAFQLACKQN